MTIDPAPASTQHNTEPTQLNMRRMKANITLSTGDNPQCMEEWEQRLEITSYLVDPKKINKGPAVWSTTPKKISRVVAL